MDVTHQNRYDSLAWKRYIIAKLGKSLRSAIMAGDTEDCVEYYRRFRARQL